MVVLQNGKALCDRYISVAKAKIIDYVNSGGNARDDSKLIQMSTCLLAFVANNYKKYVNNKLRVEELILHSTPGPRGR